MRLPGDTATSQHGKQPAQAPRGLRGARPAHRSPPPLQEAPSSSGCLGARVAPWDAPGGYLPHTFAPFFPTPAGVELRSAVAVAVATTADSRPRSDCPLLPSGVTRFYGPDPTPLSPPSHWGSVCGLSFRALRASPPPARAWPTLPAPSWTGQPRNAVQSLAGERPGRSEC